MELQTHKQTHNTTFDEPNGHGPVTKHPKTNVIKNKYKIKIIIF